MSYPSGEVAHIIPTHERPRVAQRLIDSINRFIDGAKVYVCDDSMNPHRNYEGAVNIPAPAYDIGLSAKRNLLVQRTDEPYIMLWDDDYIAYDETSIATFYHALQALDGVGIVGGEWFINGARSSWYTGRVEAKGPIREHRPPPDRPQSVETPIGDIRYHRRGVDFVANWFLADRRTLEAVPWDEELKLQEHIEFFARLAAVRGQRSSEDRIQGWRERYMRRSRGETWDADGDEKLVYALTTFRNKKYLGHLADNCLHKGESERLPVEYAEKLEERGLAAGAKKMFDTRPFPLPEVEEGVPLDVALIPDTTCIHDRRDDPNSTYNDNRHRDWTWELRDEKLGCTETNMVQWTEYPYPEPDFEDPPSDIFELPNLQ